MLPPHLVAVVLVQARSLHPPDEAAVRSRHPSPTTYHTLEHQPVPEAAEGVAHAPNCSTRGRPR